MANAVRDALKSVGSIDHTPAAAMNIPDDEEDYSLQVLTPFPLTPDQNPAIKIQKNNFFPGTNGDDSDPSQIEAGV